MVMINREKPLVSKSLSSFVRLPRQIHVKPELKNGWLRSVCEHRCRWRAWNPAEKNGWLITVQGRVNEAEWLVNWGSGLAEWLSLPKVSFGCPFVHPFPLLHSTCPLYSTHQSLVRSTGFPANGHGHLLKNYSFSVWLPSRRTRSL